MDCSVFAPPAATRGETILVQVFAHLPEQGQHVAALAVEADEMAQRRGHKSLEVLIAEGARLTIDLVMPGLVVDEPVQSIIWRRREEAVQFAVTIPQDYPSGTAIGTVAISQDNVPVGHIKFKLTIELPADLPTAPPPEYVGDDARHYTRAFISHASKDRPKVVARVQMLHAVGIDYFQDILSLEPGERWWPRIQEAIGECDLFLLFWSTAARESEWVHKEIEFALNRKAGDDYVPPEIRPVIIEGPPPVPPPDELKHLHFNDPLVYFVQNQ